MTAGKDAFQTPARAALGDERRRMVRTRRYMQAALAHPAEDPATHRAFLRACVAQMRIAVGRLIAQDSSLARQLRAVLPAEHAEDHAYLDELEQRLALRGEELAALIAAAGRLDDDDGGDAALAAFAEAVALFFDPPSQQRSRPTHSLPPLIETYGSPDAWTIAQREADRVGSELEAFRKVEAMAYPGLAERVAEAEAQAPARRKRG